MFRFKSLSLLCSVAAVVEVSASLKAQTLVDSAATINYTINDFVIVGSVNPNPFLVNYVTGAYTPVNLAAYNASTVDVNGGSVGSFLLASNTATVIFRSGTVAADVQAQGGSRIDARGGTSRNLLAIGSSQLNVYGGTTGTVAGDVSSTINIYGGTFTDLGVRANAVINVYGSNLQLINARPNGLATAYDLVGTLQDGTSVTGKQVNVSGNGRINLLATVPEPGSVALLAGLITVGAGFLRKRRFSN